MTSLPLKDVETTFAVDSSGFNRAGWEVTWFNSRYGRTQTNRDWLKVHLTCGVKTNIVTSVEVTHGQAGDAPRLPGLIKDTAKHFEVKEVLADMGYLSKSNLEAIRDMGATPFIPFKVNATPGGDGSLLWRRLYHYFAFHQDEFARHYHQRSNVETTFAMIKSKFGSRIRSRDEMAQMNEVLAKVLCHNLRVVIQSMFELGISPEFLKRADSG